MKYIRFFWSIAIILFIIPFLGVPQGFKDILTICIACIIGFFAWVRLQSIRHKREILEAQQRTQTLEEVK